MDSPDFFSNGEDTQLLPNEQSSALLSMRARDVRGLARGRVGEVWTRARSDGRHQPKKVVVGACPVGMDEYRPPRKSLVGRLMRDASHVRTRDGGVCLSDKSTDNVRRNLQNSTDDVTLRRQMKEQDAHFDGTLNFNEAVTRYLRRLRVAQGDEDLESQADRRFLRAMSRALSASASAQHTLGGGAIVDRIFGGDVNDAVDDAVGSDAQPSDFSDSASSDSDSESSDSDSDSSEREEVGLAGGARGIERVRAARTCSILEIARRVKDVPLMLRILNVYLVQQRWSLLMLLQAQKMLDLTNDDFINEQLENNVVDIQPSPVLTLLVPLELEQEVVAQMLGGASVDGPMLQDGFSAPQIHIDADGRLEVVRRVIEYVDDMHDYEEGEPPAVVDAELFSGVKFQQDGFVVLVDRAQLVELQPVEEIRICRPQRDAKRDEHVYTISFPFPSIVARLKSASKAARREARLASAIGDPLSVRIKLSQLADQLHNHFMFTPREDSERLLAHRDSQLGAVTWAKQLRRTRACVERQKLKRAAKGREFNPGLRVAMRPTREQRAIVDSLQLNRLSARMRALMEEAAADAANARDEEGAANASADESVESYVL